MSIQERLRADLKQALRARDRATVTALRTALSAIANAEAVEVSPTTHSSAQPLGNPGLGHDVPRRTLTSDDVLAILRAEVRERRSALADYELHGQHEQAERLCAEVDVLTRYVS